MTIAMADPISNPPLAQPLRNDYSSYKRFKNLSSRRSPRESSINIARAELGNDNLRSLLDCLKATDGKDDREAEMSIYLKLKALVVLHPASVSEIMEAVSVAGYPSSSGNVLIAALASASTPPAQQALVKIVDRYANSEAAMLRILPLLGSLPAPEPFVVAKLMEEPEGQSKAISSTRLLALGAAAGQLLKTDEQRSLEIERWLKNNFKGQMESEAKAVLLLAMANIKSKGAFAILYENRANSSEPIRRAAIKGLASFKDPMVTTAAIAKLNSDNSVSVRAEAARTLGVQSMDDDAVSSVCSALASEKKEAVQLAIIETLGKNAGIHPSAAECLRAVTQDRFPENVVKTAKGFLGSTK